MTIGTWVRREASKHRGAGKWHLVESVVADAAITRCGLRLEPQTFAAVGLEHSEVEPLTRLIGQPQNCKTCSR